MPDIMLEVKNVLKKSGDFNVEIMRLKQITIGRRHKAASMGLNESVIPDKTVETLARGFFKESVDYGFKKIDYLRFVNALLDIAMKNSRVLEDNHHTEGAAPPSNVEACRELPLEGERVVIRNFTSKDGRLLKHWVEDAAGREFLLSRTTAMAVKVENFTHDPGSILGIISLKDGQAIGAVAFCDHNKEQHRAELRKLIGEPSHRRMGYALEATRLWISYGIHKLKLRKIYLSTLNTNIGNIKLNEELGFQVEGILRNEVFFDHSYHDLLRMGLFVES
jgi:RimJ/RimL family protein N-acetyltransferase